MAVRYAEAPEELGESSGRSGARTDAVQDAAARGGLPPSPKAHPEASYTAEEPLSPQHLCHVPSPPPDAPQMLLPRPSQCARSSTSHSGGYCERPCGGGQATGLGPGLRLTIGSAVQEAPRELGLLVDELFDRIVLARHWQYFVHEPMR